MRALFSSILVVSSLAMVPAAYAASLSMTGTVKAFNAAQKQLVLTNGDTFTLASGFKDPGIKSGEKIKVSYQKTGKAMQAEMVKIMK